MTKTYQAECPACGEEIDIKDCDPKELAEDEGCISECPECGAEIEFDYDEATDTLVVTPGQEFEDEEIEEDDDDTTFEESQELDDE